MTGLSERSAVQKPGRRRSARNGVALVAVIVALAVFTALCHTLAGLAVTSHRQAEHDREQSQTRLLAESGLLRAVAQLKADPQWQGETWTPEFSNENGSRARKATVVIARLMDVESPHVQIRVTARLSLSASDERQIVREFTIPEAAGGSTRQDATP
jgi:type II secretory pathway component PulK